MIFFYYTLSAVALVVLLCGAVYGLHQLGLYLERQGYIYYWHTKPSGGGSSVFSPLQELTQPQIKHVVQVNDERWMDEEDAAGDGKAKREGDG
jgi:hypothetical protein